MSSGEGRTEFNARALLVTAAAAAAFGWVTTRERAHDLDVPRGDPERAPADVEQPAFHAPAALERQPLDATRTALSATDAFELDGEVRAFAFDRGAGSWHVAFYRGTPARFARIGPLFGPTDFDAPRLEGEPPALTMRLRSLGLRFTFVVDGDDVRFEPTEGRLEVREARPMSPAERDRLLDDD